MKKALLMILDGWGIGKPDASNAIYNTPTPFITSLLEKYPHAKLYTSGENVGLPDGQMGNSEVGHLNIGAGRVVLQDLVRINKACRDNSILQNPEIVKAFTYARDHHKQVHFMGLVSDGGVHSSLDHLKKLCDISKEYGITKTFVHCFMDGRDTDPHSGLGFIQELKEHMSHSAGRIASVVGRYYAMDRDNRWERIREAYDMLVYGTGFETQHVETAIRKSYQEGITDEFIKPIVHVTSDGRPVGLIQPGDMIIFFNYRNDRAKELTIALTQKDMPEYGMKTMPLYYCCMTPYDAKFEGLHILFNKENVENTLGEVVSKAGMKQLRIAETEKYAHVTYFFDGGVEKDLPGCKRILIPSPKVATYDSKPEMSANEITDKLLEVVDNYDVVILNFANCDMVGHTGNMEATIKAIETVDKNIGRIFAKANELNATMLITADHGNCDIMLDDNNNVITSHTTSPVPFIVTDKNIKLKNGKLGDIAPTMLEILGLEQPVEMTGESLIEK